MRERLAVDSSTLIAYFADENQWDTRLFDAALAQQTAYIPPIVIAEVFSYPPVQASHKRLLTRMGWLAIENDGFWERAAATRMVILAKKRKAHLPDALIAQSCIDHDIPLLTRDTDFRYYAEHCGLKLVIA